MPLPPTRTLTATQAISLGRIVTDDAGDPEESDPDGEIANLGLTSSVTVPPLTNEAVVGPLTLRRKSDAGFRVADVDLLSIVVNQLGPSLDNSLLLETVSNLAAIVEASPDIILRASTEGQIECVNPAGRDDRPPKNRSNSRPRVLESEKGEIWLGGNTHLSRSSASYARLKLHLHRGRWCPWQPAVSESPIKPTIAGVESTVV